MTTVNIVCLQYTTFLFTSVQQALW